MIVPKPTRLGAAPLRVFEKGEVCSCTSVGGTCGSERSHEIVGASSRVWLCSSHCLSTPAQHRASAPSVLLSRCSIVLGTPKPPNDGMSNVTKYPLVGAKISALQYILLPEDVQQNNIRTDWEHVWLCKLAKST
jgi:hypothetical protein